MKSKHERLNKFLLGLCIIMFFAIAAKCTAQIDVHRNTVFNELLKHDITTISPAEGLKFGSPTGRQDTIFLSVLADSLTIKSYCIRLYAFFPKGIDIDGYGVTLKFSDGYYFKCKQVLYDKTDNYCEYTLPNDIYYHLAHATCSDISLENVGEIVNLKYKEFFMDFVNTLD